MVLDDWCDFQVLFLGIGDWGFALRRLKAAWGFRIEAFCYILYFRCVSLSSAY